MLRSKVGPGVQVLLPQGVAVCVPSCTMGYKPCLPGGRRDRRGLCKYQSQQGPQYPTELQGPAGTLSTPGCPEGPCTYRGQGLCWCLLAFSSCLAGRGTASGNGRGQQTRCALSGLGTHMPLCLGAKHSHSSCPPRGQAHNGRTHPPPAGDALGPPVCRKQPRRIL